MASAASTSEWGRRLTGGSGSPGAVPGDAKLGGFTSIHLRRTQLEVLKRSGSLQEQKWAAKVAPVIENQHFLLVTLLLCNAGRSCENPAEPMADASPSDPCMQVV